MLIEKMPLAFESLQVEIDRYNVVVRKGRDSTPMGWENALARAHAAAAHFGVEPPARPGRGMLVPHGAPVYITASGDGTTDPAQCDPLGPDGPIGHLLPIEPR